MIRFYTKKLTLSILMLAVVVSAITEGARPEQELQAYLDKYVKNQPRQSVTIDHLSIKYAFDGDSLYLHCLDGFRCKDGKLGIRGAGFDTPEMRGKCDSEKSLARSAKQHFVAMLRSAKHIELIPSSQGYDKYGRLVARMTFDGVDWGAELISKGLARAWRGKRESWCE